MKRLIEFALEDGNTILVEVDEPEPEGGVVKTARPGDVIEKARLTFEQALSKITPAAESIIAQVRALSEPPNEVTVEFGLKLSAEAGAFIASASAEGNYNVTLTWKRQK